MIGEDVDLFDGEMGLVDAVRAVLDQFLRSQLFDVRGDLLRPGVGHVFVAEGGSAELVAGLVGVDGRVVGVGEAGVGVYVGQERVDVGFEIVDYCPVRVEFEDGGVDGTVAIGGRDVDATPAKKGIFAAVVVILE